MSKHRSLENQMLHALSSAKSQGESKRSYRADHGDTGAKVFSNTNVKNHAKNVTKIKIKICATFCVIFRFFLRIYESALPDFIMRFRLRLPFPWL